MHCSDRIAETVVSPSSPELRKQWYLPLLPKAVDEDQTKVVIRRGTKRVIFEKEIIEDLAAVETLAPENIRVLIGGFQQHGTNHQQTVIV